MRAQPEGMGDETVKVLTTYNKWRLNREETRPGIIVCRFLGCGARATRLAYDRTWTLVPVCSDPTHGKE